jgi:hypothetical protein
MLCPFVNSCERREQQPRQLTIKGAVACLIQRPRPLAACVAPRLPPRVAAACAATRPPQRRCTPWKAAPHPNTAAPTFFPQPASISARPLHRSVPTGYRGACLRPDLQRRSATVVGCLLLLLQLR